MRFDLKAAFKGATDQKENDESAASAEEGGVVDKKGGWFSRAASKVERGVSKVSAAATTLSERTASLLDFHSGAADVIVVRHNTTSGVVYQSTSFSVHAARDNKSTLRGPETVEVFVNNDRTPCLHMIIGEGHNCAFPDGGLLPSSHELEEMGLEEGRNEMRFSLSSAPNSHFTASLWLLPPEELLVVCDIDGTLTRSDIFGYGAHKLGYDSAHRGVTEAFCAIRDAGYRIVYLSARPITRADKTRELLKVVGTYTNSADSNPASPTMPDGPLITTAERSLPALVRTLRRGGSDKGADSFKLSALQEIACVFQPPPGGGGVAGGRKVLVGGFGNRPTDAQAYRRSGIASNRIFSVDATSRVCVRETREVFESYESLFGVVDRFFPPAAEVRRRVALEEATGGGTETGEDSWSDDGEEGEGIVGGDEDENEQVSSHGGGARGTDGGEGAGGADEEDGGGEGEDEDGFDPDVWRRKLKKREKARKVHEANVRWGFDPTGREAINESGGGGTGGDPHPAVVHAGIVAKSEGDGRGTLAHALPQVQKPKASAGGTRERDAVAGLGEGGQTVTGAGKEGGVRKTLKEMLAEKQRAQGGGEGKKEKVKDVNTVVVESDDDDSGDEGCVDSRAKDNDEEEEAAEAAAAGGAGVEEIAALLDSKNRNEGGAASGAAEGVRGGEAASSQGAQTMAAKAPEAAGLGDGDTRTPPAGSSGSSQDQIPDKVGLGLTFRKSDGLGGLIVKRVKPDSAAAEHSGVLEPGVRIVSIDNSSLDDISSARQLAALTHGIPGSVCEVEMELRDGSKQTLTLIRP